MKRTTFALAVHLALFAAASTAEPQNLTEPIVDPDLVFEERNGLVAVEAEHFCKQELTKVRAWYRTTAEDDPAIRPDGDGRHVRGASGGCYLEALPDTRRTHGDKLIKGQNFSNEPGKMAVLSYKVHINTPGRYYVWARTFSTGTEDNGLHVGLDGRWPKSGQRLQWTAKQKWFWDSKQRTAQKHTGEPGKLFLDIDKPGLHTITFAMREDGFEFDKWLMTTERQFARPTGTGPASPTKQGRLPKPFSIPANYKEVATRAKPGEQDQGRAPLVLPRQADGKGKVEIRGELKQWHNVTLTLDGPFAHEQDNQPNPFTDRRFQVQFTHSSGKPNYSVPGYFAADGDAGNTSAEAGTRWRAHLSPDKPGKWTYRITFQSGKYAALDDDAKAEAVAPYDGKTGTFDIGPTDKAGRDFRGKGRLEYVGGHYLRFAGTGEYFLKAGPDAPETFLAYSDFDGTVTQKAPLKTWKPHIRDWKPGDPTWKNGKGKGMIGALNYLSSKGCNAFSFLTYNAGGDGENVWPFRARTDKLHYDCSKLDQWGIVFDRAQSLGLYLHFKMQEQENDDNRKGKNQGRVPAALDGGDLGVERKLYCRELIARFGHALALNWNLGEENTQSPQQQRDMIEYLHATDPYNHNIVVHTFPNRQDAVYTELLGSKSKLTGASLQNDWSAAHQRTLKWVQASAKAGRPWVVANDEQGPAPLGVPQDIGYNGTDGKAGDSKKRSWTMHDIRKRTLWGTLLAGGAGVEYYFGYKLPQNDLVCEDFRSRDRSWDFCRIALKFFHDNKIPFWQMQNADALVGNAKHDNSKYCFAQKGKVYVVYLPQGGTTMLDLRDAKGTFEVAWYDPRRGGGLQKSKVTQVTGGGRVSLGGPPSNGEEDWVVLVRIP